MLTNMQPIKFTNDLDDTLTIHYMGDDATDYDKIERDMKRKAIRITLGNTAIVLQMLPGMIIDAVGKACDHIGNN